MSLLFPSLPCLPNPLSYTPPPVLGWGRGGKMHVEQKINKKQISRMVFTASHWVMLERLLDLGCRTSLWRPLGAMVKDYGLHLWGAEGRHSQTHNLDLCGHWGWAGERAWTAVAKEQIHREREFGSDLSSPGRGWGGLEQVGGDAEQVERFRRQSSTFLVWVCIWGRRQPFSITSSFC